MSSLLLTRRKVLFGILAAPLVVAAANIMPVKLPNWAPKKQWMVNWGDFELSMLTSREQAAAISRTMLQRRVTYYDDETFHREILPTMGQGDLAVCLDGMDFGSLTIPRPRLTPKPPRVSMHCKVDRQLLQLIGGDAEVSQTGDRVTIDVKPDASRWELRPAPDYTEDFVWYPGDKES